MRIVVGHDDAVANWVGFKLKQPMIPPYTALGWIDETGKLCVGFVFYEYRYRGNINIAVAATGRLTRGILCSVAHYCFQQSEATRITARPPASNERACEILKRAGFKLETIAKDYYGENESAAQYRLLKGECKW